MLKPDWLNKAADLIPMIQEVASSCDEPFQEKCFELLLLKALGASKSSDEDVLPQQTVEKPLELQSSQYNREYQNFLTNNNLSHEMIKKLIDFESGKIYVPKKLGKTKAQSQRIVACLIAVRYAANEGKFKIPRDDLRRQCESLSVYDASNFSAIMKKTYYDDTLAFDDKDDFWKVTIPGISFVASTISDLLDTKQT